VSGLHTKHPYGDLESLHISIFDLQHQRLVLVLEYPRLRTSAEGGPLFFDMKTDYNQTSQSSQGIFHTSSVDRLIVVSIEDIINGSHLAYVHAIPNSYLLDLTIKHQASSSVRPSGNILQVLSFDSWAPSRTRLLEMPTRRGFHLSVQGMRLVISHDIRRARKVQVAIYDFYQPLVWMLHGIRNRVCGQQEYSNSFDNDHKELIPFIESSVVCGGEEPLLIRAQGLENIDDPNIGKHEFETQLPYTSQIHVLPSGSRSIGTDVHLGENFLIYTQVTFLQAVFVSLY
jgi:hypothetical protein